MADSVFKNPDTPIPRRDIPMAIHRITKFAKRPHVRTVDRWIKKGSSGVFLEVTHVGHEIFTTERDIRLFFARLTQVKKEGRSRSSKKIHFVPSLSAEQAAATLDAMGIV